MSTENRIKLFVALVFLGVIFHYLSPIMTPFFLGVLLAYLGNPFVSFLNKKRIPRIIGVVVFFLIVIFLFIALLVLIIPLLQEQLLTVARKVPDLLNLLQGDIIPWLKHYLPINLNDSVNIAEFKRQLSQHAEKVSSSVALIVKTLSHSTLAVVDFVMDVILVPVVAFYLMRDWPILMRNIHQLLPAASRANMVSLALECDEVVGAFLKGQLLVMLGLAVIYATGLELVGLQVAIFVGVLSGLLAIVPYLGFIVGILVASVTMYLQTHEFSSVLYVWGVYIIGQMVESMLLTPLLVGHKIGLHPVAVIFAVLSGGLLFGFLGVLLALPVAAVILVISKRVIYAAGAGS